MDADSIAKLLEIPTLGILLFLVYRQQSQIERLLAGIIESERMHARNLLEIVTCGRLPSSLLDESNGKERQLS